MAAAWTQLQRLTAQQAGEEVQVHRNGDDLDRAQEYNNKKNKNRTSTVKIMTFVNSSYPSYRSIVSDYRAIELRD